MLPGALSTSDSHSSVHLNGTPPLDLGLIIIIPLLLRKLRLRTWKWFSRTRKMGGRVGTKLV